MVEAFYRENKHISFLRSLLSLMVNMSIEISSPSDWNLEFNKWSYFKKQ